MDMPVHNEPFCNDAWTSSMQTKTVECQLGMTLDKIAATEANVELFEKLLKLGLATNDIKNFILKQSAQKRILCKPDFKVLRSAMRSKLSDACAFLKRLRRLRDTLKKRIARKYSSRKAYGRKVVDELVSKYREKKILELKKVRRKIEFLKEKEEAEQVIRTAPATTGEFLENVNLFSPEQNSVKPEEPQQPFICDPKIQLSDCERQILAKGPKFMVRQPLDPNEFELELEKMVAKSKFDEMFNGKEDDLSMSQNNVSDSPLPKLPENSPPNDGSSRESVGGNGSNKEVKSNDIIWEETASKMPYNFKTKTLSLGNLQAPAYKYNKEIFLPDVQSPDKEISHQIRKSEMRKVFSKVSQCNSKYSQSFANSQSNLTQNELKGLKSLKNRVKSGEIVVATTDKSKRFAILSKKQYIDAGNCHTKNDIEINPRQIKKIQKNVNDHVFWLNQILQPGLNWNHTDRMSKNVQDWGEQVCLMTCLIKDHKNWSPYSTEPPPHPSSGVWE